MKSIALTILIGCLSISNSFATKPITLTPVDQEKMRSLVAQSSGSVVLLYCMPSGSSSNERIFNSGCLDQSCHNPFVKSAVIVTKNGTILTESHGMDNNTKIFAYVGDGPIDVRVKSQNVREVKVVKVFPGLGLAVLKMVPKGDEEFTPLAFGDESDVENGVIIGKARGKIFVSLAHPANSSSTFESCAIPIFKGTVVKTDGVRRGQLSLFSWGATAEVTGGCLLGKDGNLYGIAVCIYDSFAMPHLVFIPTGICKQALGIAVPEARKSPDEFKTGIKVKTDPGVKLDDSLLKSVNWPEDSDSKTPVVVESVIHDAPADKAGILPGDIILKFEDDHVPNDKTFKNLEDHSIGKQSVVLTILRDSKIIEIEVSVI
ncbi:MAG: S1C family serine protease [Holosporales bacterium]|nr:S1C family serine protease [Holosporales bacterium]